jgi:hypothetical protein
MICLANGHTFDLTTGQIDEGPMTNDEQIAPRLTFVYRLSSFVWRGPGHLLAQILSNLAAVR